MTPTIANPASVSPRSNYVESFSASTLRQRRRVNREFQRRWMTHQDERSLGERIHVALEQSGYPVDGVRSHCDGETVTLSGFVTRYFYAQMALETALKLANGLKVVSQIEVVPGHTQESTMDRSEM